MSSFTMNVIKSHPNVRMLNEPLGNHVNLFRKFDLHDNNFSKKNIFTSAIEEDYYEYYLQSLNSWLESQETISGIKEVLFLNKIEWVRKKFPNSKIIVLLRDPRGIVESLVRRNLDLRWGYRDLLLNYYKNNHLKEEIPDSRYEQAATVWKIRTSSFIESLPVEEVLLILAEDFVFKFEEEISKIMSFLNLEVDKYQIDFAKKCWSIEKGGLFSNYHKKNRIYEWKNKLSNDDERNVIRITGELMGKIGYI